ncbi:MAG: UDP-N-acetylmuramyl-tripeptide synthetase [Bdellovibrionota bacterium]
MLLSKLAQILDFPSVDKSDVDISWVESDSRQVAAGALFFPKQGEHFDGLHFIDEVIGRGVSAIVVPEKINKPIPQLLAPRSQEVLKKICQALYDHPTSKMNMIGVTGTNGKTSTSYFIEAILQYASCKVGYVGTTQYRWPGTTLDAKLTTPMYEMLQKYFYQMQLDQVETVVMECSSHGIELGRIDDIAFDVCVYTNLSHEHLDFHKTMQEYAQAKAKLFTKHLATSPKKNKIAVINVDDEVGKNWVSQGIAENTCTYSMHPGADIYPTSLVTTDNGMQMTLSMMGEKVEIFMPTFGQYNVMNTMAAMLACKVQGVDVATMKACIEKGIAVRTLAES